MTHSHYLCLVEFHTSGDQRRVDSLRDKLKSLSEADDVELENLVRIFKGV
ncbi:MAG: hypothetical protein M0Q91_18520 [Methanoregula sp.]|jgi:hypothetical protein|nr:hypothetical protein [Methanoregula sp.]